MSEEKVTQKQINSLNLYCDLLAKDLNNAGYDIQKVMSVKTVSVPWTKEAVKELLWRPIQKVMAQKNSTLQLNTKEPGEVYLVLSRHLSENFGITTEWPDKRGPKF